jgi:uncharacterized repeat protein (TIGR01451 family)
MKRSLASLSLIFALSAPGWALTGSPAVLGSSTIPGSLTLHPTIECVGILVSYTGDDNQNSLASVWYRPVGTTLWSAGPEMFADRHARQWRVSLVHLSPGTEYVVEVRFTDPDGVAPAVVSGSVRTRPDYPDVGGGGKTLYVPDGGDLQTVIDAASPGDTVRLRAGVYRTSVGLDAQDSGEPGKYLTIEAAPGEHVVLDGSDPDLNDPAQDNWSYYRDGIYYTDLAWASSDCGSLSMPGYVGEQREGDGVRYLLYRGSDEWDDFLDAPPGKAYYNCAGRLYVATYDADDPDGHEMHVSRRMTGLVLDGTDYVRVRNLEIRYYGYYGTRLEKPGADHNVIEGNTFHGIGKYQLRIGEWGSPSCSHNLIQNNLFYERGYQDSGWTWDMQYHYAKLTAIRLSYTGPGNVIRRNTFRVGGDGVDVGWQSHETDVYENVIEGYLDDGIEVDDQPGYNIRVWANTLRYCYSSISNQDWFMGDYWNSGPVYIFRNVIAGGRDPYDRRDVNGDIYFSNYAFKVGGDQDWLGRVYYYHNTITIPDSPVGGDGIQGAGGDYFSGLVARNNLWSVRGRVFKLGAAGKIKNHDLDCDNLQNAGTLTDARFIQWSHSGGPDGDGVYRNLADFQAYTGQELHGISDNGTLFNPDLSLRTGSPEIDAGCVIVGFNDRGPWAYRGRAPDIGAFEIGSNLSESTKRANATAVSTGDRVDYTIRIVNTGTPLTPTVTMTDVLPLGLSYVDGTVSATVGTAWANRQGTVTSVYWQGVIPDAGVAEIRYGVIVETDDTVALSNTARIDDGLGHVMDRPAIIIVNGYLANLPIVRR